MTEVRPASKNARVVWATCSKVYNVKECYDVPWGVAKSYVRRMKRDPRFIGGVLLVNSMPVKMPDTVPSI